MKKTAALGLIFAGIFSGFALVSCGSRESSAESFAAAEEENSKLADLLVCNNIIPEKTMLPDYILYEKLPENYSQEMARADGCIVFESRSSLSDLSYNERGVMGRSRPISGGEVWESFLASIERGMAAKVRIAFYFTYEDKNEEKYRIYDLSYQDGKYLLSYKKEGGMVTEEYAALKCFLGDYYQQEWFLLGKYFQEVNYEIVMDGESTYYTTKHYDDYKNRGISWQVIYFSDGETSYPENAAPPRWARDGMEIFPGMKFEGVFDSDRDLVQVSLLPDGGQLNLLVDGEEMLSVPENFEFRFCDILEEDASLELLVGEPVMFAPNGEEKAPYFRVTAYRLHKNKLTPVPLLPAGDDFSFYISSSDWARNSLDSSYIFHSEKGEWESVHYRMTMQGYLAERREALTLISVDGKIKELPEQNVKIDERTGVGIALEGIGAMASKSYYNIYRSEDKGRSWTLVAENFVTANASVEYIYLLEEDMIICCFEPSGVFPFAEVYASLDGGRSWDNVKSLPETKKYEFLSRCVDAPAGVDYGKKK